MTRFGDIRRDSARLLRDGADSGQVIVLICSYEKKYWVLCDRRASLAAGGLHFGPVVLLIRDVTV